ncbi:MAG: AAA family ATPase [Chloroflexi bacterium]|nr:AAA family ATPase [Chloroflexota bacterium]
MAMHTYIPQDRLRAIAYGESVPDRTSGSALFADISGFTPLTESLRISLGPRQGAEELTRHLDAVYSALIAEIDRFGGSVIGFAGDAVTCWFDEAQGDAAQRATACAFALQQAMQAFLEIILPQGARTALTLKVAIASGSARRFEVGDALVQRLDVLAGATVMRTSTAEHLAGKGEILLDESTVDRSGSALTVREWRTDADSQERFAVAEKYETAVSPSPHFPLPAIPPETLKPWIHAPVYAREMSQQGHFLTEFRPCAVLFVRFMGIDYEAEAAQAQLDSFIRLMQTITTRYNGTLLQLTIGDKGSYAYLNFGVLNAHEDDARRAVKAALELRDAAGQLQVQVGLSYGLLRVGAYGGQTRRTFGALGDHVNLAARLMSTAVPGEILLSGHIHKATSRDFVFDPRPPLPMKGKAEPLPVFALTGERQQRAIRLQEPTYALPMVGRQNELQTISGKLDLTLQGNSQVIGIVAEAGMGKSRLVAEVIRAARKNGFAGYGGACQSDAINTPYQAWKPIWSAFFDVDPHAPLRKQIRSLESELQDLAPGRVAALPLLSSLLDIEIPDNEFTKPLEPKYRHSALLALLEDCLRTAAKDEPLLIVIEDLHWIDALSHDLLDELTRALSDSRLCFVLAYRPPRLARLEAPRLEARPNFTKIELCELTIGEAEQAIRAKLAQLYPARSGAVPPILVEKLMARAQGNPFFLEELLNFLHDRGLDPRAPNALEKIELPNSLHTLILSRIDKLSEREKTTLRVASIIGRLFRAAWLTGYYPELGEMVRVKPDLDQLAELEITPLDTPEPELAYLFKHIVTHEVTYESLPFATRARLHEQLAGYLEGQIAAGRLREAPLLDTLVFHYLCSDNRAKQREYLFKAGESALEISAFTTAVEYLTPLMDLLPIGDPTRSTAALQLAEAHKHLGNISAAQAAIEQAQLAAITDADWAAALAALGGMTSVMGDYTGAQAILEEAVALARASENSLTLCRVLYALGSQYWRLGKMDRVHALMTESLTLARALGNAQRELYALNALATVAWLQNEAEAEHNFQSIYRQAVAVGDRLSAVTALNNLGVMADDRQDYQAARDYFQQALTLAREIGAQEDITLGLLNLADEEIKLGHLDAARAGSREGLALALRLGALPRVVQVVVNFSYLAYAEGQIEYALALSGLASHHPAWGSEHQRELDASLARWALDPAVVAAGLAKGAALDWDATIQALLQE